MTADERPGQVISFYSYKGGTGRTMALANIAYLLARRGVGGKGVLMVDWDLEAPGLHRFFRGQLTRRFGEDSDRAVDQHPGLIDLFCEFDRATAELGERDGRGGEEAASAVLEAVQPERFILETDIPALSMLKAGRFDERYSTHVNTFQWERLYNRSPWLIRSFAEHLTLQYPYVLIDSRTGLTDISGICTMLMPERLVVVFTPNRQSLAGVLELIERATNYRRQSNDLRPLVVFPLASRIEAAEPTLRQLWRFGDLAQGIDGYQTQFEDLFKSVYALSECDLDGYFDEVQIQHVPRFAYGEDIAALVERSGDRLSLTRSYEAFTTRLVTLAGPWENLEQLSAASVVEDQNAHAETIFASLGSEEKVIAQKVLTRLVRLASPDEGGEDTRLRVGISELGPSARPVVQALAHADLVMTGHEQASGDETVELANESLIRNWTRLRTWLAEDREFLLWRQRLRVARVEWERTWRDNGVLLRGAPRAEAQRWLAKRAHDLNPAERDFIQESLALREGWRRLIPRSLIGRIAAGAAAILLLLSGLGWLLIRVTGTPPVTAGVSSIAFGPDGTRLASGRLAGGDRNLVLWDVVALQQLGTFPVTSSSVYSVAFSPDGGTLASGTADNRVTFWDVATRQPSVRRQSIHTSIVYSVAFSPNGRILASGSADQTIILWEVRTSWPLAPPLTGHTLTVRSIAFSPDGRTLASGSDDRTIRLWDVASGQAVGSPLAGHTSSVQSVAYSPDGQTLASGAADRTVRLWRVADSAPLATLSGHTDSVRSIAFSPDGRTLASGSADKSVILWDVATAQPVGPPLAGHTGGVSTVAFSAEGQTLASGDTENRIYVWDVSTRQQRGQLVANLSPIVESVARRP